MFFRVFIFVGMFAFSGVCLSANVRGEIDRPGIKKTTRDACLKAFSNNKLDPIRGKIPNDWIGIAPTDEMLKDDNMPNEAERNALKEYRRAEIYCKKLVDADSDIFFKKIGFHGDGKSLDIPDKYINLLIEGKITYAEYTRGFEKTQEFYTNIGKWATEKGNSDRYENQIKAWLKPFMKNYQSDSPWWAFYRYAIAEAKKVDRGEMPEKKAAKLIENRRLKIIKELAASVIPKLMNLNCLVRTKAGQQDETPLTIDYSDMKVNGYKAEFTETEIRWSYPATDGSTQVTATLNRLSGFYSFGSKDSPMAWTGHCAPARRQF